MSAQRTAVREIKNVLRLKLDAKFSHEQIAGFLGLSKGAVAKYVRLAAANGRRWPEIHACDDSAGTATASCTRAAAYPRPA